MRVSVDGVRVGETTIVSHTEYGTYPVGHGTEADLADGSHEVKVSFVNDRYRPGVCDRNVALGAAAMEHPATTPAPTPSDPAGSPSTPAASPSATAPPTPTGSAPAVPGGQPSAANTGVPAGTAMTTYTGPLTITADGTVIDGKNVFGDLKIRAKNVVIRNSFLHGGTGHPGSNTGVVDANSPNVFDLLVENSMIIPDHPSFFRDGIVGHEYTARGNYIAHTNDGLGIFNRPGGSLKANVTVERNVIHDMTHWNNDPAHADRTHNDGIQVQGGENIHIVGNTIVASVVPGDGLGSSGRHGSNGILLQQNVSMLANVVVENNFVDDAKASLYVLHMDFPSITVTVRNNTFGRNQFDFGNGSRYQIRIASKSKDTVNGLGTNRFADTGALMTEGRNTGIWFDGA